MTASTRNISQGGQTLDSDDPTRWTRMSRDQALFTELLWSGVVTVRAATGVARATVNMLVKDARTVPLETRASVRMGHEWRSSRLTFTPTEVARLRRLASCPEAWSAVVEDVDLWEAWRTLGDVVRRPVGSGARELDPVTAARLVLAEEIARFAARRPGAPAALVRAVSGVIPEAARRSATLVGSASSWPETSRTLRDGVAEVLAICEQLDRGMSQVRTFERLHDLDEALEGLAARIDMLDVCVEEDKELEFQMAVKVRDALRIQARRVDARRIRVATVKELLTSGYVSIALAGSMLVGDRDRGPLARVERCETRLSWCVGEVRRRMQAGPDADAYPRLVEAMASWVIHRTELIEAYDAAGLPDALWRVRRETSAKLRGLDVDEAAVMAAMQRSLSDDEGQINAA